MFGAESTNFGRLRAAQPSYDAGFLNGVPTVRDTHLFSGLKQLRGETLGRVADLDKQIEALEQERDAAVSALSHVDAVLRQQDPTVKLESIKARRPKGSCASTRRDGKRVPVTRAVMTLLRARNVPMTVQDIVACLRSDYPSIDDRKLTQNVRMLLSTKKAAGVLKTTPTEGRAQAYSFANGSAGGGLRQVV